MINLVNDLYLDADPLQFILKKRTVVQDEKSKNFSLVGYFPDSCLLAKQTIIHPIKHEYIDSIKAMEKRVNDLVEELKLNVGEIDFDKLKLDFQKKEGK